MTENQLANGLPPRSEYMFTEVDGSCQARARLDGIGLKGVGSESMLIMDYVAVEIQP